MKLTYAGLTLADWHMPVSELTINGEGLVEILALPGTNYQRIFNRGNRVNTVGFTVYRRHATLVDCYRWAFGLPGKLPGRGSATAIIGVGAEAESVSIPVCTARVAIAMRGVQTVETYTITAPQIIPEGPINLPASQMIRSGRVAIPNNATSVDILFPVTFETPPIVTATMEKPDTSGDNIYPTVRRSSITETGCTVDLSGPPGATGHYLAWTAVS